jgi:diguanylate cyclase (GGDEF)-like protein/PAS domain S-box-containing protein
MVAWEWINAAAVAVLVSSHTDLALFVVLILPSIYYLAVPTSFRWSVASGVACSVMMLIGYALYDQADQATTGLALVTIMLNVALFLMVARSNRLQRMEWSATQALRDANKDLADSRAMFETMFNTVPIPLLVTKIDGTLVAANDATARYIGTAPETLGIRSTDEFYLNPDDRSTFLAHVMKDGQISNFETKIRLADNSIHPVLIAGMPISLRGVTHILSAVVDITDRKSSEDRTWRAASHDPLTGLPNRAFFQSRLEQVLAQAEQSGSSVTLLLLDLDKLKSVNETLGHDMGDALLRHTASRMSALARDYDLVARLAGDEFVVILAGAAKSDDALALAEQILTDLKRPFQHEGSILSVQASIGIASYPDHDRQPSDLLKDADLAVQSAQSLGSNRAVVYTPGMRQHVQQGTETDEIYEALRSGQIVPFYQPKVDLRTGGVVGFEALARWLHPVRGVLSPAAFQAAFADPELSIAFGEYMIRRIAVDIRTWMDDKVDCGRIAVNLATAQFNWVGLTKRFLDILDAADIPFERLAVEITETVFLERNASHVLMALKQFQEAGVRIALDDFGTGYASLIHLKRFPIDDIKIDRSFINDLADDHDSAAIVHAVIDLGKSLGMVVVAEGVERPDQAEYLRARGCPQAQGNLYSPPMEATQVPFFLERWKLGQAQHSTT